MSNHKKQKTRSPAFIDIMRILTDLDKNIATMDPETISATIAVLREEFVYLADEVHDLKTALSKSDRKCNALSDAIQHMAEKNGGLRHRISNLQSLIGKLNQPVETQDLKVAENENGEAVWIAEDQ